MGSEDSFHLTTGFAVILCLFHVGVRSGLSLACLSLFCAMRLVGLENSNSKVVVLGRDGPVWCNIQSGGRVLCSVALA